MKGKEESAKEEPLPQIIYCKRKNVFGGRCNEFSSRAELQVTLRLPKETVQAATTPCKRNLKTQTYEAHAHRKQSWRNLFFSVFYQIGKCFVYKLRISYF